MSHQCDYSLLDISCYFPNRPKYKMEDSARRTLSKILISQMRKSFHDGKDDVLGVYKSAEMKPGERMEKED